MKGIVLFFSLFFAMNVSSQTIINAEKLGSPNDSLLFAIEVSYSGTRGNAVTDQIDFAPSFILIRKRNDFKLFAGYSLLSADEASLLNSGFTHFRHNYKISKRLKTFEFYQIQFNEVLLLTKREAYGAGLRYSLVNKDSLSFDMGIGLMQENEFLNNTSLLANETANTYFIRGTIVSSFEWIINKSVKINNVLYFQPNINSFKDYRVLNDFSLITQLSDAIYFTTSLTLRYDSRPPSSLKGFDSVLDVGIGYTFSK